MPGRLAMLRVQDAASRRLATLAPHAASGRRRCGRANGAGSAPLVCRGTIRWQGRCVLIGHVAGQACCSLGGHVLRPVDAGTHDSGSKGRCGLDERGGKTASKGRGSWRLASLASK